MNGFKEMKIWIGKNNLAYFLRIQDILLSQGYTFYGDIKKYTKQTAKNEFVSWTVTYLIVYGNGDICCEGGSKKDFKYLTEKEFILKEDSLELLKFVESVVIDGVTYYYDSLSLMVKLLEMQKKLH
jgi:hypothetical protein